MKLTRTHISIRSKWARATIALLIVAIFVTAYGVISTTASTPRRLSVEEYRRQLQSQVDTPTGAPISGRDPANQAQYSLYDVASTPSNVGPQKQPAADLSNDKAAISETMDMHDHKH